MNTWQTHLSPSWIFISEKRPEPVPFRLKGDRIDLDELCPEKPLEKAQATLTNDFILPEERILWFGIGCDWWCEVTFNGEIVFSTFPAGNGLVALYSPRNHVFPVRGVKGKNALSIRVCRGSQSWTFCFREFPPAEADPCAPLFLELAPSDMIGKIKVMNAVNNGPILLRSAQTSGNFEDWKKLEIPLARNHDASFCSSYGGEHCVDVHAIFPDFNADPADPASYDFTLTDNLIADTLAGGTQTFYRLGSKIEHNIKKYGTKVPPDFRKWAVVCEHIIRHYNEGWADGFHHNIRYWEIWNEADGSENVVNKTTWQGTPEEFFDLYRTAACHLKRCFPHLKIGGPAICGKISWMKRFLASLTKEERVPLDFFSWHSYINDPIFVAMTAQEIRRILDSYGYTAAESILDEWNYIRNWTTQFVYSVHVITGLKGAVFAGSVMCACQDSPVDMLMYYDARPCAFNGLFQAYTYERLKGYYTFLAWKKLRELGTQFKVNTHGHAGVYACGATDGRTCRLLLTRYWEADRLPGPAEVSVKLKKGSFPEAKLFLLDEEHDLTAIPCRMEKDGSVHFRMAANTLVLMEF